MPVRLSLAVNLRLPRPGRVPPAGPPRPPISEAACVANQIFQRRGTVFSGQPPSGLLASDIQVKFRQVASGLLLYLCYASADFILDDVQSPH